MSVAPVAKKRVSYLPRDPVTGKIKAGPGRPKGKPSALPSYAKGNIVQVFDNLGGVEGMTRWAKSDAKNLYAFYVHVYPKVLGAQAIDEAAAKLAQRPMITRIENVIIDPRDDYRTTVLNPSSVDRENAEDVQPTSVELADIYRERARIREAMAEQIREAGAEDETSDLLASEFPL